MIHLILALALQDPSLDGAWLGQHADPNGTVWRSVWSFRPDGTVLGRSPESSLEDFLKGRALTDEEKKSSGTYERSGGKVRIRWADGKEAEIAPGAGGFKWGDTEFRPLAPWTGRLTGHFECFRHASMGPGSHWLIRTWTFWDEGLFQFHEHSTLFSEVVETRSRDTEHLRAGGVVEIWRETYQQKVPISKSSKESLSGRWKPDASGVALDRTDAKKRGVFVGVVKRGSGDEPWLLLIDGWLYRGVPGKFIAADAPDSKWTKFAGAGYELSHPPDWAAQKTDSGAAIAPKQQTEHGEGVMVVLTVPVDASKKATDADMVDELRKAVRALPGLKLEGERVEYERIDGDFVVRLLARDERKKAAGEPFELPIDLEAHLIVKGGVAVIPIAQWKRSLASGLVPDHMRAIALSTRVTAKGGGDLDITLPKGWTLQKVEGGTALLPPGMKHDPEGELNAMLFTAAVDGKFRLVDELRRHLKQAAPDAKAAGEPEKLTVDGAEAVLVRMTEKDDEGDTWQVLGYGVVRHGRTVWLVVVATDAKIKEHGAALRAAFESVKIRE